MINYTFAKPQYTGNTSSQTMPHTTFISLANTDSTQNIDKLKSTYQAHTKRKNSFAKPIVNYTIDTKIASYEGKSTNTETITQLYDSKVFSRIGLNSTYKQ